LRASSSALEVGGGQLASIVTRERDTDGITTITVTGEVTTDGVLTVFHEFLSDATERLLWDLRDCALSRFSFGELRRLARQMMRSGARRRAGESPDKWTSANRTRPAIRAPTEAVKCSPLSNAGAASLLHA